MERPGDQAEPHDTLLIHVTTPSGWTALQKAGAIGAEPFMHLCTEAQLAFVLEKFFPGDAKLMLLRIDTAGLDIRWEHSEPGMDPFPHFYGSAPIAAVKAAEPL